MRNYKFLVCLMLVANSYICLSDNWLPFNLGQKSYFQIDNYYSKNIENKYLLADNNRIIPFIYDSLITINDVKTYYSKEFIESKSNYKCLKTIYDGLYQDLETSAWICNRIQFDSIQVISDTIVINEKYLFNWMPRFKMNMLKIPIYLQKGDSYKQDYYSIQCDNVEFKIIFENISDSIRSYRIFNKQSTKGEYFEDYYLELSKNFGIIRFSQWDNIYSDELKERLELKLCGTEINGLTYGTIPKKYTGDTFFGQKVGDVKYWAYLGYQDPYKFYNLEGYLIDSLKSISTDVNKIIFKYKRLETINGVSVEYEAYEIFDINEINDLLNNSGRVFSFIKYPEIDSYLSYQKFSDFFELSGNYVTNPIWSKGSNSLGYFIYHFLGWDFESCKYANNRRESELMLFPNVGLTYSAGNGDGGGSVQILLAYKSGDEVLGVIPEPLAVNQELTSEELQISPNPASDYINVNLSLLPMQESEIQIYDVFGNEMQTTPALLATPPKEGNQYRIDISILSSGVYFVQIGNAKPIKFVKL